LRSKQASKGAAAAATLIKLHLIESRNPIQLEKLQKISKICGIGGNMG
jgi:hypothetical protein